MAITELKLKDNCHLYLDDLYTTDSLNRTDNVKKITESGNRVLLSYAGTAATEDGTPAVEGGFNWSNREIGSAKKPIFINSAGQLQASNASIGEDGTPIYIKDGVLTPFQNFFIKTATLEKPETGKEKNIICRISFSGNGTGILIITPKNVSKASFSKRILLLKRSKNGSFFSTIEATSVNDFPVKISTDAGDTHYKISNETAFECDIIFISFSPVSNFKVYNK